VLEDGPHTVVGVVRDSGVNLLANDDATEVYVPNEGAYAKRSSLILHAHGNLAPLLRLIPSAAARTGLQVTTELMRTKHDQFFNGERTTTLLVGAICGIATALAAAGMFALVAFAVAQRTRELGIRIAIGAKSRNILAELLMQNLKPTAGGVVAGVILAAVMARLVHQVAFLKSTGTLDPLGLAAGLVVFALIAAVASLAPALRALRIDPSSTLRCE
jgi:putative ABC transport system permease protein